MSNVEELEKEILILKMRCNVFLIMTKIMLEDMKKCGNEIHNINTIAISNTIKIYEEFNVDYNDLKKHDLLKNYPDLSGDQ